MIRVGKEAAQLRQWSARRASVGPEAYHPPAESDRGLTPQRTWPHLLSTHSRRIHDLVPGGIGIVLQ